MRTAVGPNSMGDKIQATLRDLELVLAENADLRAKLDARRDEPGIVKALVGLLRAEGYQVLEPGAEYDFAADSPKCGTFMGVEPLPSDDGPVFGGRDDSPGSWADMVQPGPAPCPSCGKPLRADGTCGSAYLDCANVGRSAPEEVADFPAGVRLRVVNGALWDGRYVVTTGKKSNHGELPCVNVYSRDVVLPEAKDYAGKVYVVNASEHEWLPDPRTAFEVGQTLRLADGRWVGRLVNIAGAKIGDHWPARLLGKAVEVEGHLRECPSSLLLIDPKDPDEQKAEPKLDSPPLNGTAAPKRNEPAKDASKWTPDADDIAKMTGDISLEVAKTIPGFALDTVATTALVDEFKKDMAAKGITQSRWGLPFKGWAVKKLKATATQTTIPGP